MFRRSVRADLRERTRRLPGDELVANPIGSVTHGITIQRSPHEVWPWLTQMGAGRAGWYSYDLVDNGGRRSAERILPELQYEPERSLVLGWVPEAGGAPVTTWALVLEEPEPGDAISQEIFMFVFGFLPHGDDSLRASFSPNRLPPL
jgi:hypothetical protein